MNASTTPVNRRSMLKLALAGGAAAFGARYSFANVPAAGSARFVFLIMRGALDGLSAVPPYGDPDYARLRGELAIAPPGGADAALPLNGLFGLNPGLSYLHEAYQARELLVMQAVATPYRERSHFDGQDVLENGLTVPHASESGWLNRALQCLPSAGAAQGVALGQNVPLVLRGAAPITSWAPSTLPELDTDTLQRIADRYAGDALLAPRLSEALATSQMADQAQQNAGDAMAMKGDASTPLLARSAAHYVETVHMAASFLRREDGPAVAVFDTTGWDTHFNEGGAKGQLRTRLAALDQGLRALHDGMGDAWSRTVVLIATEFGRTAAANGTHGTDHGTATAAFLLGGAVAGGRVQADWPGLSRQALYQERDLMPTLSLHSVIKSVLADHLRIARRSLDRDVFPASVAVPYLPELLRA